jgi:hypothetical protein
MIAMVVTGAAPIHLAAFTAASVTLLLRTLTMDEAYRAVSWKAIFLVAAVVSPMAVHGQDPDAGAQEAFFRAVAGYFQVSLEEVTVLRGWDLVPDEIPVVLFLADRAGVSPDALAGLRRGGGSWWEVAQRFDLGPQTFHLTLPDGEDLGILARVYGEYLAQPPATWGSIELTDDEVVALVNLRVLSEHVGVPPLRVLRSREAAGSFMAGFPSLLGAQRAR